MFKLLKTETPTNQVDLSDTVTNIKKEGAKAEENLKEAVIESTDQAKLIISGIKSAVSNYVEDLCFTVLKKVSVSKATALKESATAGTSLVYSKSKEKAKEVLANKPLVSIAAIAGTGILLGYLIGLKKNKND